MPITPATLDEAYDILGLKTRLMAKPGQMRDGLLRIESLNTAIRQAKKDVDDYEAEFEVQHLEEIKGPRGGRDKKKLDALLAEDPSWKTLSKSLADHVAERDTLQATQNVLDKEFSALRAVASITFGELLQGAIAMAAPANAQAFYAGVEGPAVQAVVPARMASEIAGTAVEVGADLAAV